jgi:antirestriction protein ArdC
VQTSALYDSVTSSIIADLEKGSTMGHEARLKRKLSTRFGSESYAAEELVAELASAFLCAELGVQGELRHSGYIDHWIKLLKSDPRAIFMPRAKHHRRQTICDHSRSTRNDIHRDRGETVRMARSP